MLNSRRTSTFERLSTFLRLDINNHLACSRIFWTWLQPCIQAQVKENIKAPRHWPLCGEFTGDRWTGDRWIPRTNDQCRGKCFHLMTSSWILSLSKSRQCSYVDTTKGRFKNTYELLNLRALKISMLGKNHIFQCVGKIFCVEYQRVPLKFRTKISYPCIERCRFYSQVDLKALRFKSS